MKQRAKLIGQLKKWNIDTDIKTMNFYRCQSHLFPYVRAVTNNWRLKDAKHLVLQFWGNENFPSTAVPFEIKYQDEE